MPAFRDPAPAAFEVLWPWLPRWFGHKAIYAMQVERVVGRIGWRHAEPALRSLIQASLVGRDTAAFDRSRELAGTLPAGWERGRGDAGEGGALLRPLRTATPTGAQELVATTIRGGLSPRTTWDALRLVGSELFWKRRRRTADTGRLALLPTRSRPGTVRDCAAGSGVRSASHPSAGLQPSRTAVGPKGATR